MKRKRIAAGAVLAMLFGCGLLATGVAAQDKPPSYTKAEYDALEAARNERSAQAKVRLLDDFVAKFPESDLMPFVLQLYYPAYKELRNYPKTVEFADKLMLKYGDKLDNGTKLQALYTRAEVFEFAYNPRDPNAKENLTRAVETAHQGIEVFGQIKKPDNVADAQWDQTHKAVSILFHNTAGFAALQLKDYPRSVAEFKSAIALEGNLPATWYRMGVAYLQQEPPQSMDGFWALGRALALKIPNESQVRNYLRSRVANYQGTACEKEIDAQVSELLTLAASAAERPASYAIPSAADLDEARKNADWFSTLKAGGDPARKTWLALCGGEFPEVGGKVIEVAEGNDSVVLKLFLGATPEETEAGTTANMEVKVNGQPTARLLKAGDPVRFSGTLSAYTPDPFMIHWDNGKINAEDLPEEKAAPAKAPAKKAPAKKRPAKRPPAR